MRSLVLVLAFVTVLTKPVGAAVTILDSGVVTGTSSATTATVTPVAGTLLLFMVGWHIIGSPSRSVTGMSLSWTQVEDSGTFPVSTLVYRAVSAGASGTVNITFSANQAAIHWQLLQVDNINTTTNQGVVRHASANLLGGPGSPTCLTVTIGAYANPRNVYMSTWMLGSGNAGHTPTTITFAKDPDVGWAAGPTTVAIPALYGTGLATEWLIVRGSDNFANCTWTWDSGVGSDQAVSTMELASGPLVKHRVYQQ